MKDQPLRLEVYNREESLLPYFIHYEKFLETGTYQVILRTKGGEHRTELLVSQGVSPNIQ